MLELALNFFYLILHITEKNLFPKAFTPQEERECLDRLAAGDPAARKELIERNLRLVAHIVKKYYSTADEQDDLVSIGSIGLIKAIDSYREDKNVKLGTYASKCIRNEILMYFRSKKKAAGDVSINEEIDSDKDGNTLTLSDIIASDFTDSEDGIIERLCSEEQRKKLLTAVKECLTDREREIIELRYNISEGKKASEPLTQKLTAEIMGISRSYVSRLEKAALEKLKKEMD